MTTEYLREFILLAETGNYNAAADPLFISEATLSRHIMALEQELGTRLFNRLPRSIKLTEAGTIFMTYARQIVSAEDLCRTSVKMRSERSQTALSIGFDEALAGLGVIDLIMRFALEFPEFSLQLTGSGSFALRDQVNAGTVQLAFVLDTPSVRLNSLKYREWRRDRLALLLSPSHPLSGLSEVGLDDLSESDLLLPQQPSAMYELCLQVFASAGVRPISAASAALPGAAARQLLETGLYAAVLPRFAAQTMEDPALLVKELRPAFDAAAAIIYNPDTITQAGNRFLDYAAGRQSDET